MNDEFWIATRTGDNGEEVYVLPTIARDLIMCQTKLEALQAKEPEASFFKVFPIRRIVRVRIEEIR